MRHPVVHWSEAEAQDDPLGTADRQVLRQTLERKRRNDLVRQREFEQLRRLRQKAAAGAQAQAESSSQPTSMPSSLTPPDARAVTLQKIDAIEEQMSQQWWRRKQPADASTMPMYLLSSFPQPDSVHVAAAAPRRQRPALHRPRRWTGMPTLAPRWRRRMERTLRRRALPAPWHSIPGLGRIRAALVFRHLRA
ncbi:hypothetical protein ACFQOZ_11085 [Comamonas endophytica]|uniref:hypothetical protein n=1 Tax=Comamonas endophytica TaxID=2949090 RepID=UPI003620352B